ncbi:hypothetical protein M0812_23536 [Anaeramoeba flamelloides]|uniref:Uncharacterized protein n=1 Tax=Anaeramoeba flamelloides TaxID=1746091 RepID=A0AAV7YL03_9EUKA|nr:hypothetical protein M0812_23536 [Anaeramoeba flamelloides]
MGCICPSGTKNGHKPLKQSNYDLSSDSGSFSDLLSEDDLSSSQDSQTSKASSAGSQND